MPPLRPAGPTSLSMPRWPRNIAKRCELEMLELPSPWMACHASCRSSDCHGQHWLRAAGVLAACPARAGDERPLRRDLLGRPQPLIPTRDAEDRPAIEYIGPCRGASKTSMSPAMSGSRLGEKFEAALVILRGSQVVPFAPAPDLPIRPRVMTHGNSRCRSWRLAQTLIDLFASQAHNRRISNEPHRILPRKYN
jgi:hypothetical protein